LGLSALSELIVIFPKLIGAFTDIILERLDDIDLTIRRKALDLISTMVKKKKKKKKKKKLLNTLFHLKHNINILYILYIRLPSLI